MDQAESVLQRWWCEAMLDTGPEGDRITEAALSGMLPTTTIENIIARRRERGLTVE